jgi:hypothetical protein
MASGKKLTAPKKFRLKPDQLARAKKALGAASEPETIVLAVDQMIGEGERNRMALRANRRFLKSGIIIRDPFGMS